MKYPFYTCDVFTSERFGGNPLAVITRADGLTTAQMQKIAREFNFSETTFVLPAEGEATRKVRIFTPAEEIPFAGHPNIGTAFVLATCGELGPLDGDLKVVFEEQAGLVPIDIATTAGAVSACELKAPQALTIGPEIDPARVASALSLDPDDIETGTHLPCMASVGLGFLMVELGRRDALARAQCDLNAIDELEAQGIRAHLHPYTRDGDGFDIRARMFAPTTGVPEDPATGSANCALAALLAHYDPNSDADTELRIAQGIEMGRPSLLVARTEKREGEVTGVWIGGASVMVTEGMIDLG